MSLSAIELRHLRYFVAVVEHGSFRGASLSLHVSQPPITRQVQQLEEALGVKLLVRKPRGAEPTDAGAAFFKDARMVLTLIETAANRASLTRDGRIGRLDIGIFGSAIFGAIPMIIHIFRQSRPLANVVLHNLNRSEQLQGLRDRRLDVGFNRFFGEEPDLVHESVHTERFHVALNRQHPLASRRQLGLADIEDQSLIVYPRSPRPGFIDQLLGEFHRKGLTPNVGHEVDDIGIAVSLVASGFGVSLVTDSGCNLRLPGVVYVPLKRSEGMTSELCMIHRADDDSALLQSFVDTVRSSKSIVTEELHRRARSLNKTRT